MKKSFIKTEISIIHFLFLITSKLLIGIGLGVLLVTKVWFAQPYWYIIVLLGVLILIPSLYYLMKVEAKKEINLRKKI